MNSCFYFLAAVVALSATRFSPLGQLVLPVADFLADGGTNLSVPGEKRSRRPDFSGLRLTSAWLLPHTSETQRGLPAQGGRRRTWCKRLIRASSSAMASTGTWRVVRWDSLWGHPRPLIHPASRCADRAAFIAPSSAGTSAREVTARLRRGSRRRSTAVPLGRRAAPAPGRRATEAVDAAFAAPLDEDVRSGPGSAPAGRHRAGDQREARPGGAAQSASPASIGASRPGAER